MFEVNQFISNKLIILLLLIVIGYLIASMFINCSYDTFSVGSSCRSYGVEHEAVCTTRENVKDYCYKPLAIKMDDEKVKSTPRCYKDNFDSSNNCDPKRNKDKVIYQIPSGDILQQGSKNI